MEDPISAGESEGGSSSRVPAGHMIGTLSQIAWAIQIKSQLEAEFDRVRANPSTNRNSDLDLFRRTLRGEFETNGDEIIVNEPTLLNKLKRWNEPQGLMVATQWVADAGKLS